MCKESHCYQYLAGDSDLAIRLHLEATSFEAMSPDYNLSLSRDRHSVGTVLGELTVTTVPEVFTEVSPTAFGTDAKLNAQTGPRDLVIVRGNLHT